MKLVGPLTARRLVHTHGTQGEAEVWDFSFPPGDDGNVVFSGNWNTATENAAQTYFVDMRDILTAGGPATTQSRPLKIASFSFITTANTIKYFQALS
ncbi:MAG: hypothetical protein PHC61_15150 [Chitinivibrionales bacterium]|nr:hypothetical protein [Chitinivibrionales bacterium]